MMRDRSNQVYSGIDRIPRGASSDALTNGCLVLEGGAFRGVYTAGVLDALMLHGINLQTVIGCSAGALNGLNYVAGQIGRSGRINLGHRHDPRYVGARRLLWEGSLISFDFLFRQTDAFEPLNRRRFFDPNKRFAVVVADCRTGEAKYPERDGCGDIFKAVQASASMPYVSRTVDVDGAPCLDGGCVCNVPYAWALEQGFEKVVVVRTRQTSFRKRPASPAQRRLAEQIYRKYPAFAQKLANSGENYNRQCDEMAALAKQGAIYMIEPSASARIQRLEGDMEKLGRLYWLGYHDAEGQIDKLNAYLGG